MIATLADVAPDDHGSDITDPQLCLKRIERNASALPTDGASRQIFAPLGDRLDIFIVAMARLLRDDPSSHGFGDRDLSSERRHREREYTDLLTAFAAAEELFPGGSGDMTSADGLGSAREQAPWLAGIAQLRADCQQLYHHVLRTALERRKASRQDPVEACVAQAGFADVDRTLACLREWRRGYPRALHRPRERQSLESILPDLIQRIGHSPAPDRTLAALDLVLNSLPASTELATQWQERPQLLSDMLHILSLSPELGRILAA